MIRSVTLLMLLPLGACTPLPDYYPVPAQRPASTGSEPEPLGPLVSFSDPRATQHIVDGFLDAALDQTWRWAQDKATVRVRVADANQQRFVLRAAFPEGSHNALLPIHAKIFINDRLWETVTFAKGGHVTFARDVSPAFLRANAENRIRCETDPVYVAEADKIKLGMIISEIGFEPRER